MPAGKPAGVRCVQLDEASHCRLFGLPERPQVCSSLRPTAQMCGGSSSQAMAWLTWLEQRTDPAAWPASAAPGGALDTHL